MPSLAAASQSRGRYWYFSESMYSSLPGLIGQDVQSFTLDSCGNLTLNARKGWKAQFGRVLTPEERSTLKDKVAALKALGASGQVDFATVQYVNVMNPTAVAVPYHDGDCLALAYTP